MKSSPRSHETINLGLPSWSLAVYGGLEGGGRQIEMDRGKEMDMHTYAQ